MPLSMVIVLVAATFITQSLAVVLLLLMALALTSLETVWVVVVVADWTFCPPVHRFGLSAVDHVGATSVPLAALTRSLL